MTGDVFACRFDQIRTLTCGHFRNIERAQICDVPRIARTLEACAQQRRLKKREQLLAESRAVPGGITPEKDVELKILQVLDDLDRTVAIRKKFPD